MVFGSALIFQDQRIANPRYSRLTVCATKAASQCTADICLLQIQLAFSSREPYFPRMVLTESVSEPLKQNQSPDATGIPAHPDQFVHRHIGPNAAEAGEMLASIGFKNLDELIAAAVPENIRLGRPLQLPAARTESEALASLKALASQNQVFRSYIGMGYYDCITPAVIQRNVLENPGWYTQYTPYQAEISQGRLEALLNFQTMVADLTGLDIANASLLDEATAAAEAMTMCHSAQGRAKRLLCFRELPSADH